MRTIIILFFIGFNLLFTYSQENMSEKDNSCPDYIITNGDTIRCYVITEEPYDKTKIKYSLTKNGKVNRIKIDNILELKKDSVIYDKIIFDDVIYLMHRAVKGTVSLYFTLKVTTGGGVNIAYCDPNLGPFMGQNFYSDSNTISNVYYITDGKYVDKITRLNYKKIIKSYINNPIFNERIENMKYKDLELELESLVIESNKKQESQ